MSNELMNVLAMVAAEGKDPNSNRLGGSYSLTDSSLDLRDAVVFMDRAHDNQKYAGVLRFGVHPYTVARVLSYQWRDVNRYMMIAALLHDVIEDTPVTQPDIEIAFGSRVADLVWDLTDVEGNRKTRRESMAQKLRGKPASQLIKSCDVYANMAFSYHTDQLGYTDNKWGMYLKEYEETKVALPHGSAFLFGKLDTLVANEGKTERLGR